MTLSTSDFRAIFPEFADPAAVSDTLIAFNLTLAYDSLNPIAWGDRLDAGAGFYAAHYVAMALQRAAAFARGVSFGSAGVISGVVTSKSVGGVSKSMDVSMGSTDGGGSFNTTSYGREYLDLLGTVGIGVMQF